MANPQDKKNCHDGKFYHKLAKAVMKELPPLPASMKEDLLEKERQKKYARQIKMVEKFNKKKAQLNGPGLPKNLEGYP